LRCEGNEPVTERVHERIPTGPPLEGFVRNHDEKTKDMIRSILPSKARKGARDERAAIHRHERAHVRASLHEVTRLGSFEDFEGDLEFEDRRAIQEMVSERRDADKVGPLERWAGRAIATDCALGAADYEDRYAHFAGIVSDNTIGRHALQHLSSVIGTPPGWELRRRPRRDTTDDRPDELRVAVETILNSGAHGDLNRHIKAEIPNVILRSVFRSGRWTVEHEDRPRRLLAGRHDLEDFIADVRCSEEATVARAVVHDIDR
jgi:hypothetical protein